MISTGSSESILSPDSVKFNFSNVGNLRALKFIYKDIFVNLS